MKPADEVWHELVLHGVGGKTVEEAKQCLSYREALNWFEYIQKHGTPNQHLHQGFAMLAAMINNAMGGKADMKDFMLKPKNQADDEAPASIHDVFNILAGGKS